MSMIHADMQKRGCGNTGLWIVWQKCGSCFKMIFDRALHSTFSRICMVIERNVMKILNLFVKICYTNPIRNNITVIDYKIHN
jgi:hypothetical protein